MSQLNDTPNARPDNETDLLAESAAGSGVASVLYGWDSLSETWHGPNELGTQCRADRRLLRSLQDAPSGSWYGPVTCRSADGSSTRFFAVIHDLTDCAVALLYCDESKSGPVEIVAVVPASRRASLREEFAFEFLSFARFLRCLGAAAEMEVHDAITAAIAEQPASVTIVFSLTSGLWSSDLDSVLSEYAEKLAVTLGEWLSGSGTDPGAGPVDSIRVS